MRVKSLDILSILIAVAVVVGFSLYALEQGGEGDSLVVETDEGTFLYPLDQEQTLEFDGPLGEPTVLEVRDGQARFVTSPCRDKICIAAGALENHQEWAACLPNRVFAQVLLTDEEGEEDPGVDAGTY
ncbi:MAG: NusG domain II-containing protein [Alkalispirochaetaceae bacterium]